MQAGPDCRVFVEDGPSGNIEEPGNHGTNRGLQSPLLPPENVHLEEHLQQKTGPYVTGKNIMAQVFETLHRRIWYLISIVVISMVTLSVTLTVLVRKERPVSEVHVHSVCPPQWIGVGNKCFYFSDNTGSWTSSRDSCKSLEADLVQIDTEEEMDFLKRYKGPHDHWIGLSRESRSHRWKWTNNTEANLWYKVRGTGENAYLTDNGVSSGKIYTDRKWICNKPSTLVRSC